MTTLSPTQQALADKVAESVRPASVQMLSSGSGSGGLRPGAGISTIFRAISAIPGFGLLTVRDLLKGLCKGSEPLEVVFRLALDIWSKTDNLLVDDLDVLACPETIYSNRLSKSGESQGFYRTAGTPVMLLKALVDYAIENKKCLIFASLENHALRFTGAPLVLDLEPYTAEDFQFFFDRFGYGTQVDAREVHHMFPSLSPSEMKLACLAAGSGATTETVIANIVKKVDHGALDLEMVDAVDLQSYAPEIKKKLEQQLIKPFEGLGSTENRFAAPKAGILLFGPPGTGKTSIGRWMAHRLRGKLFMVKEMALWKELQETFAMAEAASPSVVFIDDIDVLLHRSKVAWGGGSSLFRFLLSKMDGISSSKDSGKKHVTIVMTCETPRSLPDALIRSGRIELWLKTEYPKGKEKARILKSYLDTNAEVMPVLKDITQKQVNQVANKMTDLSPADLRRLAGDTQNILAASEESEPFSALEQAVEDLRKMRDEVESFMKQMYQ